jgi:cytochrome P450
VADILDAKVTIVSQARSPVLLSGLQSSRYLLRFLFDPLGTVKRGYDELGPFIILTAPIGWPIRWRNPHPKKTLVCGIGPDFNREVMNDPTTWRPVPLGPGGPRNSAARRVSVGIFNFHEDKHKYYRQLLIPPLSRKAINAQSAQFGAVAAALIERWPVNETIDLWAYSRALIQTMAISLLFGDDRERGIPIAELVDHFYDHVFSWKDFVCPFNFPGTPYSRMLRDGKLLQAKLIEWAKCKRGIPDSKDLFSIVANNPDENGATPSFEEIVGHVPPLMVAAFETCQNALIWTLVLLCQHPRVARDLFDELEGRLVGATPSLELIDDLPLFDAVINESLRILPPVPQQFRAAQKDTVLANIPVHRRTKVLLSPFLTNRDPDLYPDPDCFKPERWAGINPSPYDFFVFSAGPRMCPGSGFGRSVVKVLVATILMRFRVALASNAPIDYKVTLTLTPKGEIPATLHRHDSTFSASPIRGSIRKLVQFPN